MGNLSEHFNHKDFVCRCTLCRGEYKIHLGLVGALELLAIHFGKIPKIVEAFRCEALGDKYDIPRKNSHRLGKAAHIKFDGINPADVFKFAETIPEIKGIGYYPDDGFIHIDTRSNEKDPERSEWVKENGKIFALNQENKAKYGLI